MSGAVAQALALEQRRRRINGKPPRRRVPRPPRQFSTRQIEREYSKDILALLERAEILVEEIVIANFPRIEAETRSDAIRLDAPTWASLVRRFFNDIRNRWEGVRRAADLSAQQAGRRTSARNLQSIQNQIRSAIGVDPFISDPQLDNQLESFVGENVALIRTLGDDMLTDVEGIVMREFRGGRRASEIERMVRDRFGVTQRRARLIAIDQVQKLNGDLTRVRHQNLGIDRYIWRSSRDEKVRPEHAAREGMVFRWDDPPADGHPGKPIRCRCTAEPYLQDLL